MTNDFKRQLDAKRQAAKAKESSETASKPVSAMTEAELDREEQRLRAEIRRAREREVQASRQKLVTNERGRPMFVRRSKRRPWK